MDRTRRQDRRHRETIRREHRVAHDEDLDTGLARRDGGERESIERESEPASALRDRRRRIENAVASTTARKSLDQPAEIRDDRTFEPERAWTARRAAEKRRPATQLDPEIHDDSLALGVDRRVRHLRERLPQVVDGGPVEPTTTRRGRVVAHAPERLVRLQGHRLDVEPRLLGVETGKVAEAMIQRRPCLDRRGRRLGRVLVERPRGIVDREMAEDARLRIGVLEDRAPTRFDQQHLARSEATASDGLRGGERHGARFRCDSHHPIRRDREGRRTKPVPVDERADALSISENDGGRAVPRREHACRPATQCRHVRVRCPAQTHGLGDRRQQRRGEVPPGRRQQLEALVERERVGAVRRQQPSGVEQLGRDRSPAAVARPPADLLAVAADRVDLPVVGDRPERLSEPPDGRGVRCVSLVEDRVRDFDRRPQVRVQLAQSRPRDQALVDDGPARCRWHRQPGDRTACRSRGCLQTPPSDDQPTFEQRVRRADRPRDDRLDHGRTRQRGSRPERPRLERNGSPANDRQTGIRENPVHKHSRQAGRDPASRQEQHDDPRPLGRACPSDQRQQRPRERHRHAGAVARLAVGGECPTVGQRREACERERQHPRMRPTAGVRHEPDSARIVLEPLVVQRRSVVALVVSIGGVHLALAAPKDVERPPPGWDGGRVDGVSDRAERGSVGRSRYGRSRSRPAVRPSLVRSGRPPRHASRGRCPSPRPWPTPGSRGSGRRP